MINELRFLIADIDGTLVNEPRDMLDLTRKILEDLHKRGVLIGIASGRPLGEQIFRMAQDHWHLTFHPDCFIGMNGGQLQDSVSNTYEEFYKLEPESIKEIIGLMRSSGIDANPFIYIGEDMLSERRDEMMYAAMKRHNINCTVVDDISELWADATAKILFRLSDEKDMAPLEEFLAKHPSDRYAFFKTQPTMMEFQDPRVTKAIAMKAFCANNDIPVETVMAFGDMTNDNEMLKEAGWSVCLLNGSDDTKACADVITELDNDHDGFGHYMADHWYKPNGWTIPE